jgi:hypothetical protein
MNLKSGWNRRSFLSILGAIGGGLLSPGGLNADGMCNKKNKLAAPGVDGNPIVPITSGLGLTGDIYARAWGNASDQYQRCGHCDRRIGDEARGHGADASGQSAFVLINELDFTLATVGPSIRKN